MAPRRGRTRRATIATIAIAVSLLAVAAALFAPRAAWSDDCVNAPSRTGASSLLPDCRAFEQVTPVDKEGTEVYVSTFGRFQAGLSGSVRYGTRAQFGDARSASFYPLQIATRGRDAWMSRALEPFTVGVDDLEVLPYVFSVSPDQTGAVVFSLAALTPGAIEGGSNVYLQRLVDGRRSYSLITAKAGTDLFLDRIGAVRVVGGSPDFSTVILSSRYDLAGSSTGGQPTRLYRFANGELSPLAANVTEATDPPDVSANDDGRPVSIDQSRVTFLGDDAVYQTEGAIARVVSHPRNQPNAVANGSSPVALPDGSSVFFASTQPLAANSRAGSASLYRWTNGTNADLLADAHTQDGQPITHSLDDLSVRTVSADGALVRFTSSAQVLPDGPTGGGLYALDTATRTVALVTPIPEGADPLYRSSPDGYVLTAVNHQDVGTYDLQACTAPNEDGCADQLFVSRASADHLLDAGLTCVTCQQQPYGPVSLGQSDPRSVLDDGRVFFTTRARLAPDVDANAVADVYEDDGDGASRLLSSGQGIDGATFGGVSADGRDVFFASTDRLVPGDDDELRDVYDARVDGGIASQQQAPTRPVPCDGAACRPAPAAAAAPSGAAASSADPPQTPARLPAFSVATPSPAALRTLARTGRLALAVKVGAAGTVSGQLRATVGNRFRTVAARTTKATKAQTVTLALRLTRAARRRLAHRGRLSAKLTVAYSRRTERVRKTIRLTTAKPKGGRR